MKKKWNGLCIGHNLKSKLLLKMKLLAFILFVSIASVSANSYSQQTKFNMSFEDVTVRQVFQEIEENSEFIFLYSEKSVDLNRKVSILADKKKVNFILDQLFEGTNNYYEINDRQIAIMLKKERDVPAESIKKKKPIEQEPQKKTIKGKVTDEKGLPLPGVSIVVKGTTTGIVTNFDGIYTLELPDNAVILVYSFIGMVTQEIRIEGKTEINIILYEDVQELDDVIVVGYSTMKKGDLTGSVGVVDMEQISNLPVNGLDQALQGQVSGVQVTSSGGPGGGVSVRVRGYGTIGNNDPLYIIDGVPTKSGLNHFNMNDIESIQVLKDASATAIYGSRAANGVIVVTTKKGRFGESKITFDSYVGMQSAVNLPEMLNTQQYADLFWQAQKNAGLPPSNEIFGDGDQPVIPEYLNDENTIKSSVPGTEWFNELFSPALMQFYNLGYQAGNENLRSAISLSFLDQNGIMKYTGFNRINFKINTEYKGKYFTIGENLFIAVANKQSASTNSALGSRVTHAYRMNPIVPVKDINGNWASSVKGVQGAENPVALNYYNRNDISKSTRIFGDIYAELTFAKDFSFRTNFGVDILQTNYKNYDPKFKMGDAERKQSKFSQQYSNSQNYIWNNLLKYNKNLNGHNIAALIGTEAIKNTYDKFGASRSEYLSDEIDYVYLNTGEGLQSNFGYGTQWALFSVFSRVDYNYNSKYILSASVRRDGSSRFSKNNKHATFPAFSTGWRISEESFMQDMDKLDDLKLRFAWGQSGNQEIGNFPYYSSFTTSSNDANYDITGANTSTATGFIASRIGNPDIRWETTTQMNFGIDASLFQRVNISADYFIKNSEDILLQRPTLAVEGQSEAPFVNTGKLSNKGFELQVNYNSNPQKDFTYSIGGNISIIRNKVLELANDVDYLNGLVSNSSTRNLVISRTEVGLPIAQFYGYVADGIFKSQQELDNHAAQEGKAIGRIRYKDVHEDGVIDEKDRTVIGNPHPDFMYALNFSASYKKFDVSMIFQGVQGVDLFNFTRYYTDFFYDLGNRHVRILDSWSTSNPNAKIPRISAVDSNNELRSSSYFVEDGSFLRIKNLQLGYTTSFEQFGVSKFRVYVQAQNLFTFTKYEGMDPEVSLVNNSSEKRNLDIGVDRGIYPNSRTILLGVNIEF